MNFINLFVSGDYTIAVKDNNLTLRGQESIDYPLDDIGVVMLESLRSNISVYALSKLVQVGATVFVCNEKHLPVAQLIPSNDYYKQLSRYKTQTAISKPRLKNLWKEIIKAKIDNQARCLQLAMGDSGKLSKLGSGVKSGDVDNYEAQAAAYYFPRLFGKGFFRESDDVINSALNYAYAIVRGIIARQICSRGFLPFLGIFHKNEFNAFNLADDLIEPFRPIVDFYVYTYRAMLGADLTSDAKKVLFGVVNVQILSGDERHSLAYAIERMVESVISYYEGNEKLLLPVLLGCEQHRYE